MPIIWKSGGICLYPVITWWKSIHEKGYPQGHKRRNRYLDFSCHGSPDGLYGYGLGCKDFDNDYAVDEDNKDSIKAKNLICIWCYAADFGKLQNLKGFFSGMFISNSIEALLFEIVAQDKKIWQLERNFCDNLNELIRTNVPMDQ